MDRVRCFIIESMGRARYSLRRFSMDARCGDRGLHDAHNLEVIAETDDDPAKTYCCTNPPEVPKSDPRWPKKCGRCEYLFSDSDYWQVWGDSLYRRQDTGEIIASVRRAPPGALWRAEWFEDTSWVGLDGQSWECMLPDGTPWFIDGKCSNCTRPNEPHLCWVRTGTAPDFTVGKEGNTCAAGAGSIMSPGYHGFLRNGWLERC